MASLATLDTINALQHDHGEDEKDEWLSFKLDNLDYAIDILRVREIRTWEHSTRVPYSPDYVVGLINLRGAIVPIVDLRKRFGIAHKEYNRETVILILDVVTTDSTKTIGMAVDAISDVLNINQNHLQKEPDFDLSIEKEFVQGIANDGQNMLILINVDTVLNLWEKPFEGNQTESTQLLGGEN